MIAKQTKVIMTAAQLIDRAKRMASKRTFYKNKYPYNLCYIHTDGRTSADCVNLLCTELSHLSLATSRKDILTHIVTRIERCRLSGRSKQRLFLVRCRIHIDREKHSVIAHMKLLYVIFHACLGCVMLRSIRHADRLHL